MTKSRPSFLLRAASYLWEFKTTLSGKLLIGTWIFATTLGAVSLDIPIYLLVCSLAALLFVCLVIGWIWRPKMALSGEIPPTAVQGNPFEFHFLVENFSRFPVWDIALEFFDLPKGLECHISNPTLPAIGSRHTSDFAVSLNPRKRGVYAYPEPTLFSLFPFALFRTKVRRKTLDSATTSKRNLIVYPSFYPLETVSIQSARRYQPGGIPYTSNIGESTEYVGNREYVPGDPLRRIDYKSWGRLARPVIKEFHEEYYYRIGLVLDTEISSRKKEPIEGHPQLEAGISLTAAIADFLLGKEHVIDLFAAGPVLYNFTAGRNKARLENLLEILACIEATATNPFEILNPELSTHLAGLSTVICILNKWDEQRQNLLLEALSVGCEVKAILILSDKGESIPDFPNEIMDRVEFLEASDIQSGRVLRI